MSAATEVPQSKPFLKWAGGKGQLLHELLPRAERAEPYKNYHEPFVGGGALFHALTRNRQLLNRQAYLSDANPRLIDIYLGVKEHVDEVIDLLLEHKARHTEDAETYYYAVRAEQPEEPAAKAARLIYLNKTCFNGLFRENSRGEFNVPLGSYKNPAICDERNLRESAAALADADIECRPFETVLKRAKKGDFVYFDPPYHPVSETASFTGYHQGGFGEDDQRRLAEVVGKLDKKGVKVLLSNSDAPFIQELYADYTVDIVQASRAVNSRADRRGKVAEVLVRNFGD